MDRYSVVMLRSRGKAVSTSREASETVAETGKVQTETNAGSYPQSTKVTADGGMWHTSCTHHPLWSLAYEAQDEALRVAQEHNLYVHGHEGWPVVGEGDTSYRYGGITVHPQSCACSLCYRAPVQPYPIPVAGGYAYVCEAGHAHVSMDSATRCGRQGGDA